MSGAGTASFIELALSDFRANRKNWKARLIMFLYRVGRASRSAPAYLRPLAFPYRAFYRIVTDIFIGIDIPLSCEIGPGARIFHGFGLVLHANTKIGSHVVLRHGVTIGMSGTYGEPRVPVIGDYVDIGAAAMILGGITVGDHAVIGASAVVVKDVPERAVVVGNPARVVRIGGLSPALARATSLGALASRKPVERKATT
jgi:serine acetyltransferase